MAQTEKTFINGLFIREKEFDWGTILSVDIDVNKVNNMTLGYGESWALYQNGQTIQLQNGDYLIWN